MYTTGPHTPHARTSSLTCFGSSNHSRCASNSHSEPAAIIATIATLRTFSHGPLPPAGFSRDSFNVGAAAIWDELDNDMGGRLSETSWASPPGKLISVCGRQEMRLQSR